MATRAFAIYLGRFYLDRNRSLRDFSAVKLNQPAFQLAFLRHNPLGQDRGELLVKGPQKIKRHRLKFRLFHGRSTTFPIRVQYNILRTILRSIHLPQVRSALPLSMPGTVGSTTCRRWTCRRDIREPPCVYHGRGARNKSAGVETLGQTEVDDGRSIPVYRRSMAPIDEERATFLMKSRSIFPTTVLTALIFQLFLLHKFSRIDVSCNLKVINY